MKAAAAVKQLQRVLDHAGPSAADLELVVPVCAPGAIGAAPRAAVSRISAGFDWDRGVVFAHPEAELSRLTAGQVAAIQASASRGQSWHAYQREKGLRDRIKTLREIPSELVQFFDEWEQILPKDAREALRPLAENARAAAGAGVPA